MRRALPIRPRWHVRRARRPLLTRLRCAVRLPGRDLTRSRRSLSLGRGAEALPGRARSLRGQAALPVGCLLRWCPGRRPTRAPGGRPRRRSGPCRVGGWGGRRLPGGPRRRSRRRRGSRGRTRRARGRTRTGGRSAPLIRCGRRARGRPRTRSARAVGHVRRARWTGTSPGGVGARGRGRGGRRTGWRGRPRGAGSGGARAPWRAGNGLAQAVARLAEVGRVRLVGAPGCPGGVLDLLAAGLRRGGRAGHAFAGGADDFVGPGHRDLAEHTRALRRRADVQPAADAIADLLCPAGEAAAHGVQGVGVHPRARRDARATGADRARRARTARPAVVGRAAAPARHEPVGRPGRGSTHGGTTPPATPVPSHDSVTTRPPRRSDQPGDVPPNGRRCARLSHHDRPHVENVAMSVEIRRVSSGSTPLATCGRPPTRSCPTRPPDFQDRHKVHRCPEPRCRRSPRGTPT
ncbi:hypothetical protein DFQ13_107106 [Actinokineospora spheciospongiae]|nr:hypothetical protein DFQ13_107106 [Actinokineospora spheciospongiae]